MVLVCTPSMRGIEKHLASANDGCVLSVVGETPLEVERSILEDMYMTVRFCKSFGYGRGNKAYEFGCCQMSDYRFPHTMRANIEQALKLLAEMEPIISKHLNIMAPKNPAPLDDKINIFNWV